MVEPRRAFPRPVENIYLPGDAPYYPRLYGNDGGYACNNGLCHHVEDGITCIFVARQHRRVETVQWSDDEITPS